MFSLSIYSKKVNALLEKDDKWSEPFDWDVYYENMSDYVSYTFTIHNIEKAKKTYDFILKDSDV